MDLIILRKLDELLARQPSRFDLIWAEAQALNASVAASKEVLLERQRQTVTGLSEVSGSSDPVPTPGGASFRAARPAPPSREPVVFRRRTHGGPPGPALREKLLREARR